MNDQVFDPQDIADKFSLGAVIVRLGYIVNGAVLGGPEFSVYLPPEVSEKITELLNGIYGSPEAVLKLKPGVPIKDQEKIVHHD